MGCCSTSVNIVRAQNQFKVPLVTAAFTVLNNVQGMKHTFHKVIRRNFSGALMSSNWGDGFLSASRSWHEQTARRPKTRCLKECRWVSLTN